MELEMGTFLPQAVLDPSAENIPLFEFVAARHRLTLLSMSGCWAELAESTVLPTTAQRLA